MEHQALRPGAHWATRGRPSQLTAGGRGRRRSPGRPVTWGTADAFLDQFGLESLDALPGLEELMAAGLLDRRQVWSTITGGPESEEQSNSDEDDDSELPFDTVEDDEAISLDEDRRP